MKIDRLDHLVLTVRDLEAALDFYTRVLGMRAEIFGQGRHALHFGAQKINLHVRGAEFQPHATHAIPGSADLCFIAETPLTEVIRHLEAEEVALEMGPVERLGAQGMMRSIYLRDPDGNLIEIANYLNPA